jgi:pimeloyl-ACP methyl ester carboxylesterase
MVEECGHFIPEEKPEFVIEKALEFFAPLAKR